MLPAELEVEAQVRFEQYGGFNKGRGMMPEVLRTGASIALVCFIRCLRSAQAGTWPSVLNHCFQWADSYPCLGAGPPCDTGEETRALSLLLLDGRVVLHWPNAITWHTTGGDSGAAATVVRMRRGPFRFLRQYDPLEAEPVLHIRNFLMPSVT